MSAMPHVTPRPAHNLAPLAAKMPTVELQYVIADVAATLDTQRDLPPNDPRLSWLLDTLDTYSAELYQRA